MMNCNDILFRKLGILWCNELVPQTRALNGRHSIIRMLYTVQEYLLVILVCMYILLTVKILHVMCLLYVYCATVYVASDNVKRNENTITKKN